MEQEFKAIYDRVQPMFAGLAEHYNIARDEPGAYYLDTHEVRQKNGYRTPFGGVEIKKRYVSVHLFPVYTNPNLLGEISEMLRKRMQGKSCFNFNKLDETLIAELESLVNRCA